jgi:hypothetical protein
MEWIKVSDRLPSPHEKVNVLMDRNNILIGIMGSDNEWYVFWSDGLEKEDEFEPVTHWMPLPEPPKQ